MILILEIIDISVICIGFQILIFIFPVFVIYRIDDRTDARKFLIIIKDIFQ